MECLEIPEEPKKKIKSQVVVANKQMPMVREMKGMVATEKERAQVRSRVIKNPVAFTDYTLHKIVLIGDCGVGKTSLLLKFSEKKFEENYNCTIGVDFKICNVRVDDRNIKLQIWDTAGQERFRSISQAYYRNSHGCIAVYDVSKRDSFKSLQIQIDNFLTYSRRDEYFEFSSDEKPLNNIILVGTKSDLVRSGQKKREVDLSEAIAFARQNRLKGVVETSAKDDEHLDDCFFISAI
jgi:small GTP-binding protein